MTKLIGLLNNRISELSEILDRIKADSFVEEKDGIVSRAGSRVRERKLNQIKWLIKLNVKILDAIQK